jgi:hypothetical protein
VRRLSVGSLIGLLAAAALSAQAPGAASGEWRFYGGNAASTRYSPLDQITRTNVNTLEVAWRWTTPDNEIQKDNALVRAGAYQDTPLMINGVLYTQTGLGCLRDRSRQRQDDLAVRPRDLERRPAAEPRLHAPRHGLLDRWDKAADHQRHARRAPDFD